MNTSKLTPLLNGAPLFRDPADMNTSEVRKSGCDAENGEGRAKYTGGVSEES